MGDQLWILVAVGLNLRIKKIKFSTPSKCLNVECYAYVLKIGIIISISKLIGDTLPLLITKEFLFHLLFCLTFSLYD